MSSPKRPIIVPSDADVKAVLAEIADHPEITLSRREILRFILVEPTKRSEEIQTLLKLDEIGQTRSALSTAQNRLQSASAASTAQVQSHRSALQLHLQISTLRSEDLLEVVNKRRKVLELQPILELTTDTKLDAGLLTTAKPSEFNKESALRDVKALSDVEKGFSNLAKIEAASIVSDLTRLESDPSLLFAFQRRSFIEKGLSLVDDPTCPLCDSPWPSQEHLREHLRTKLSKSEEARQIQNSLLRNGSAIAGEIIRVTALMAAVLKLAQGQDDKAFVQLLNSWKTDLEALKAKLATVDGITGLKSRLEGGWLETQKRSRRNSQPLWKP